MRTGAERLPATNPKGRRTLVRSWTRRSACVALTIAASLAARSVVADSPPAADALLSLVPADASLVLTFEGLRDHARSIGASRLAADFRRLPAVRAWLESERYRHLERACEEIERSLDVKLADLRDKVLGDAVVLVVRLAPDAPPDPSQARGLLLLRAADATLMERLIATINKAQRGSGELARLGERRRGGTTYHAREFPDGSGRPPEWYVTYPDGTFAFSNSEDLIRGVIDRKGPRGAEGGGEAAPSLGESPKLQGVRRMLPEHPLARLYVDPRTIERLMAAAARPTKPSDLRVRAILERHLAAIDYAGAALVWRPGAIVVDAVETLEPSRVDGWLRRWAGDRRACRPELRRVPATAVGFASAHVDFTALRDAVYQLVSEADHPRLRNLEAALKGLMLGQELSSRILPALGPGVVAYLEGPSETNADSDTGPASSSRPGGLFPLVVVVDLSEKGGRRDRETGGGGLPAAPLPDAIDNALRTLLSLMALDEKRGQGKGGIRSSESAGVSVRTLSTPLPFAYAVDRAGGRLVLGTSAPAVARYLQSVSDPEAGARFRDLHAAAFERYETFVCVDLDALSRLAERYRDRVARNLASRQKRPAADVNRDLEHVLALSGLFRAAFIASGIEPDASAIHRRFGVILKDGAGRSAAGP